MFVIEFEGKTFPCSVDGFVPLKALSRELFDLSTEDMGSFFDPEYRFYDKYNHIRHKLRHNVSIRRIQRNGIPEVVYEGGIYHEDFNEFIRQTRLAIDANNQAFDEIVQQWEGNTQHSTANPKSSIKLRFAQLLRKLAYLLRRIAK